MTEVSAEARSRITFGAVLGSVGIVFGDIATSPLYALQECLAGPHGVRPERANVFGVVSLIFWSLILVVTLKYLLVLMRADNKGEGGIMALLALIPRGIREKSPGVLGPVTVAVLVGAAFLFGDGIITPAISVLSAVEGLKIAAPSLQPAIVPISVAILLGLFLVQKRGTGGLAKYFGPVMVVWLVVAGVLGVIHVAKRPEILWAMSPVHAANFFALEGFHAFRVLGGVVLAVTGGEALYADMGHFGRGPIRVGWLTLTLPALVCSYFGQGALILDDPSTASLPFYSMVPTGAASYPFVLLGTMATVIASQALISGVFSLVHQSIQLGYFPRLPIRHTSSESAGQIYVPVMNWFLAGSCIALVVAFQESAKLTAAFGLAVSATMGVTSIAFYVVARQHFGWSRAKTLPLVALFLVGDVAFTAANALKFFDGGWVPVVVGSGFTVVMLIWARGRGFLGLHFREQSEPRKKFLATLERRVSARLPGVGVVMTASADFIPPVLLRMVRRFRTLHETVLLTTVVTEEVPTVADADRWELKRLGKGLHRLILRYGFMDEPRVHEAVTELLAERFPEEDAAKVAYVLGHERFVAGPAGRMGVVAETLFSFLSRNAGNPSDYYGLPTEQVVEIGARIDL